MSPSLRASSSALVLLLCTAVPASARVCPPASDEAAVGAALLERYVAAVNAHDTGPFPELFTEGYIQHSGRTPSGLAAQIENFGRILDSIHDVRVNVED